MIYFDVETFSEVDLASVGHFAYAAHKSTDVLCAAWELKHVGQREYVSGLWRPGQSPPVALFDLIERCGAVVEAHKVEFDAEIWRCVLAPRYGWWWPGYGAFRCSMAKAMLTNLPGQLALAAGFFADGEQKDRAGHALMMKLCKPAKPIKGDDNPRRLHTPAHLDALVSYCQQDVRAERSFSLRVPNLSPFETQVFHATWAMNRRGLQIDRPLVLSAVALAEQAQARYRSELQRVTGGAVASEHHRASMTAFLAAHGAVLPQTEKGNLSLGKQTAHLIDLVNADEAAHAAMRIYKTLNRSSIAKYDAMLRSVSADGRIRGAICYAGAGQTGRDAGRLVQFQNLPRGVLEGEAAYDLGRQVLLDGADVDQIELLYGDVMAFLSSMIRPCVVPAEGSTLMAADYSAIEGRVLAWLAGEQTIVQAYRDGKRMYAVAAAGIYGCTYEQVMAERAAGHKKKDQTGKVADLACGYGGSTGAMERMGGRNLGLTQEQMLQTVTAWRESHPNTVALWRAMQDGALRAMRRPMEPQEVAGGRIRFGFNGHNLKMELPSGRCLWYRRARLGTKTWPDGGTSPQVEYYGVDDNNRCGWLSTYGGKLVENAVQAISRDLLMLAAVRAEEQGWPVVLRVHDELLADVPPTNRTHHDLCDLMVELPAWAAGLPVDAAGWTGYFYRKD